MPTDPSLRYMDARKSRQRNEELERQARIGVCSQCRISSELEDGLCFFCRRKADR